MNKMNCLREPAFEVGEFDDKINHALPPVSGEEYIKRVVIEAQQCADVVVANIDKNRLKKPTVHVEPLSGCVEAPPWLLPALEWQMQQMSDFSNVRLYVSQLKNEIQTAKRKWRPPKEELPDTDNETAWVELCTNQSTTRLQPTLNLVFCLNQPMVERILECLVEHIAKETKIGHDLGQWLYALLVLLEMPLNPDTCSCLRTLARTCSLIRANSSNLELEEVRTLNLFICLVARYFRQLDLADP